MQDLKLGFESPQAPQFSILTISGFAEATDASYCGAPAALASYMLLVVICCVMLLRHDRFGPNLGPGANSFSPGGLPPDLLGEASPNKVSLVIRGVPLTG